MRKLLVVGEMVADISINPVPNIDFTRDSITVKDILLTNGGDAMNNAVNLAKLGNDVSFISLAGNDRFAGMLVDNARDIGVDMQYMAYSETVPSTKVAGLIREDGQRIFLYCHGTASHFTLQHIDLNVLERFDHLHIGGVFHLPAFDGEGTLQLLQYAKQIGLTVSMDVTWDESGQWGKTIGGYYPYLDFFLPSENEAAHLTGETDAVSMAEYFKSRGVGTVVIKMGEAGCYCSSGKRSFFCEAYKVPVVDTTGAGDSFVSGFMTGVHKARPLEECVKWGTSCAAIAVQSLGATTGTPTFDELSDFLRTAKPLQIRYL
jgi:sugar/nucleoside kinase (ribokinase family)